MVEQGLILQKPDIEKKQIKGEFSMTKQLYYKNAIAVFGLVPMFSLMVEYYKLGMETEIQYCKNAIIDFKSDKRFLDIVQKNRIVLNGNLPVIANDINKLDVVLLDLGYYEVYTQTKLQQDMQSLINFVNNK